MTDPKPEHRIKNLETEFVELGARIEEHASDTAESLNAIRQDIEELEDKIDLGFKQAHVYIQENIEIRLDAMATKEDLRDMATKGDLSKLEVRIDSKITAMKNELLDAIKQHFQQKQGG